MAISVTNPAMIERQHLMADCSVTPAQIAGMMAASDAAIMKSIAAGRAMLTGLSGEEADRCAGMLRAFEIEADLRGIRV